MPLPKIKKDPHADVDVHDFSTASKMTIDELTLMGDIAAKRGEGAVAFEWKSLATEKIRVDENQAAVDGMLDAFAPHEVPPHGAPILVPMDESWEGDTEYRKLSDEWRQAQAKADAGPDFGPDRVTLMNAALTAREKVQAREQAIKVELSESGVFTAQDQRTADAQKSLVEKSAQIAAQFSGES